MYIGVDDTFGLIHSVATASAEIHDLNKWVSFSTAKKPWCVAIRCIEG